MEELNTSGDDFISNLPLDLIRKIISFLTYPYAARTRQLSRLYRGLWDAVLVQHGRTDDLLSSLMSFLDHIDECDPGRHPWRLLYQFGSKNFLLATVLDDWQLRLEEVSRSRYISTPLFHLSFKLSQQPATPSPPPESSFYVKSLHLRSLSHLTSFIVSSLVTNLDHLESLHIEKCKGLHSLHVSSSKLEVLHIFECLHLSTLHINTPKLKHFRYKGYRPWILAKGLEYKLNDAMLDFRRGALSKHLGRSPELLLLSLMNVTSATICCWNYEEVIVSGLYLKCEKFKFFQLKELRWIDKLVDETRIRLLISFLRLCPCLEKLYIIIDANSCNFHSMAKGVHHSPKGTKLPNLKFVKIEGCVDERDEALLVEYVFGVTLTKPVIISKLQGNIKRAVED